MNRLLENARREWEITVLVTVIATGLLLLILWFNSIDSGQGLTVGSNRPPQRRTILNQNTAFDFTKPMLAGPGREPHPFSHIFNFPAATTVTTPWRQRQQTKTVPSINDFFNTGSKPARSGETPVAPVPVPRPTPPPKVVTFEYRGCMTTTSGERLALIQNVESDTVQFLGEGGSLGSFKVREFNDQQLVITDPADPTDNGNVVEFGQKIRLIIK